MGSTLSVEGACLLAAALGTVTPAFLLCIEDPLNPTADEISLIAQYRATDTRGQVRVREQAMAEAQRAKAYETG